MRPLSAIAILLLAACASEPLTPVASIAWNGQTYPVTAVPPEGKIWRVRYEGETITCTRPEVKSCYWSLRNYISAQEALDM